MNKQIFGISATIQNSVHVYLTLLQSKYSKGNAPEIGNRVYIDTGSFNRDVAVGNMITVKVYKTDR
jgi:hypothetical protein